MESSANILFLITASIFIPEIALFIYFFIFVVMALKSFVFYVALVSINNSNIAYFEVLTTFASETYWKFWFLCGHLPTAMLCIPVCVFLWLL